MLWRCSRRTGLVLLLAIIGSVGFESALVSAQAPVCGSVTDSLPWELPALSTLPATGQSYVDPVFGCTITRLSNAAAEGVALVQHFYSSVNPFNANSTLVLLQKAGGVQHIRDLSGNIIRDNLWTFGMQPLSDAMWSRTDPNVIYFHPVGGNELRSYNVATDTMTVLHTFAGYLSVWFGHWEADLSWDGDHIPVLADDTWGFIYTISTGAVTPAQNLLAITGGVAVDVFDLAPSNRAVLRWGNLNGGVAYFDQNMNFLGQITTYAGHSDRARDADGTDLEVAVNAADLTPPPGCSNAIVKVRLAAGTETCLRPMDWSLAQHVSCNNIGQGWCLVSTYMGVPGAAGYANELMQVKLDGSQTVRLAHSRSTNAGYDHFPRAAVSADGKYVLFDSDMQGTTVDVYLLHVAQPGDSTPPTVAITAPAGGATVAGTSVISASASDNVGVVGVQFKLDGVNLGAEVTVSPYSIAWNTGTAVNGVHTLTAVARDAAGNIATSAGVSVTVANADTTPPTVAITAPIAGTTVGGTVTVTASASDNLGVVGVQFKLDGANLGAEVTVPPYSIAWNTGTAVNGVHTLKAVARDAAGNIATSAGVSVTVANADTTPPTVAITAPIAGTTVLGTVTVAASASDNVGVVGVQFTLDAANLGAEVAVPPYAISWNTTTAVNGSHTLTAVARDAAGNSTASAAVLVTVSNDTTPPVLSGVSASSISSLGATISWTTNEGSDSQVEYGPTLAYGSATVVDPTLVTAHSQGLSGLAPGTLYHYRVKSRDAAGNLATSGDFTFTTLASLDTGLAGYWKFDEGAGTTAADSSGNGNTGTLIRGPVWTPGKLGSALAFNGRNEYVSVPHADVLNAYPLTVAVWMKTGTTTGVRGIVNKYVANSYNGYQVFMNQGNLCAWYLRDGANYVYDAGGCTLATAGYADNQWHQVVFVVDAAGARLYVDGVQKASLGWTGTAGPPSTLQSVQIGHYPGAHGGAEYFAGVLDDVRIYNRALSPTEVLSLYNGIAP